MGVPPAPLVAEGEDQGEAILDLARLRKAEVLSLRPEIQQFSPVLEQYVKVALLK